MSLPGPIQAAMGRNLLKLDMTIVPEAIDEALLVQRLYDTIRDRYGPFEISQEEGIRVLELSQREDHGVNKVNVRIVHYINLDFCSISDKWERSVIDVVLDEDLSRVESAEWQLLGSWREPQESDSE